MIDLVIDLGAYRRNLRVVAERIAPAEVMAVVKAGAYGHGAERIARVAIEEGIRWIGALDGATALRLVETVGGERPGARDPGGAGGLGGRTGIRLFTWLFSDDEDFGALVEAGVDLGVSYRHQLDRIAAAGASRPARLHLKIDTGLHRNGALEEDWPDLVGRAVELERAGIAELVGVWTHIGEASDDDDTEAIRRFRAAVGTAEGLGARFAVRHLAASAAGLAREDARFDLVRVGAFGYGIAPGDGVTPAEIGIEPVMTASATVQSVVTRAGRRVAVLPVGYLDGVPTASAGRVVVALQGRLHRIVEVAAGFTRIELDEAGTPASGEITSGTRCVLFGPGSEGEWTLQQWADALGTIGEEIVVRLTVSATRRYRDG